MADTRFWLDMDHRATLKRNDKLMVGNSDTQAANYIDIAEVLTALTADDLPEGTTHRYYPDADRIKVANLPANVLGKTQADTLYYPLNDNPAGYLNADSPLNPANLSGMLDVALIPDLPASKIVSGVLNVARIPSLDASKTNTGVFSIDRIPDLPTSKITGLSTALGNYIPLTQKGAADGVVPLNASIMIDEGYIPGLSADKITSGVFHEDRIPEVFLRRTEIGDPLGPAGLDEQGKIFISQLPDTVLGQVKYVTTWDAVNNVPELPPADSIWTEGKYAGLAVMGSFFIVAVAGEYEGIQYAVGDWILSDGEIWDKIENSDAVTTVFGRVGNVLALAGDYNAFYIRHDTASQGLTAQQQLNARTNISAVPVSRQIIAGTWLQGGGDLSQNRGLNVAPLVNGWLLDSEGNQRMFFRDENNSTNDGIILKGSNPSHRFQFRNSDNLTVWEVGSSGTLNTGIVPWARLTGVPDFALNSNVVHLTGDETIAGTKLFSNPLTTTYTTPDADGTANSGNSILGGLSRAINYASLSASGPANNTVLTFKASDARTFQFGTGTSSSNGFWYRPLHTTIDNEWIRVWDPYNLPNPASDNNVIHTSGNETKTGQLILNVASTSGATPLQLILPDNNQNSIRFENTAGVGFIGLGNDNKFRIGPDANISATGSVIATETWVNSQGFLTSVPTLTQVLTAGSSTGITANFLNGIKVGRISTSIIGSGGVDGGTFEHYINIGDSTPGKIEAFAPIVGVPAESLTEVLTGVNAGFGLSWNATTKKVDFGINSTLGANDYHYIEIPPENYMSLGDLNDVESPAIYVRRDDASGVNDAKLISRKGATKQAIISAGVSSTGIPTSGIEVLDGSDRIGIYVGEGLTGLIIRDEINNIGLVGQADYTANIQPFSYTQKPYVDGKMASTTLGTIPNQTISGNTSVSHVFAVPGAVVGNGVLITTKPVGNNLIYRAFVTAENQVTVIINNVITNPTAVPDHDINARIIK